VSAKRWTPSLQSEDQLAVLAMQGSADAWGEIARRHTHRVVVSLLAAGVPLETAEDLAQEVWIRLMRQQQEGRLQELRLPGLAIAQAAWLAREAQRTQQRRNAIMGPAGVDEPTSREAGPEQLAWDRERLELVTRELSRCSERSQQVFLAVYGPAGESHAEAARRLGLSLQRVRQIICEVRARLRIALERTEEP